MIVSRYFQKLSKLEEAVDLLDLVASLAGQVNSC